MIVSSRLIAPIDLRTEADIHRFCAQQPPPAVAPDAAAPKASHVAVGLQIGEAIQKLSEVA
jgi:hypothetical protein